MQELTLDKKMLTFSISNVFGKNRQIHTMQAKIKNSIGQLKKKKKVRN